MSPRKPIDLALVRATDEALRALAKQHPELTSPEARARLEAWIADQPEDEAPMEEQVQTAFRLPKSLLARLEAHAERMMAAQPGLRFSRADAVRVLLTRALDLAEAEAASTKAPRKGSK